jgi:hypothetical protein
MMHNYSFSQFRPRPERETALEAFAAGLGLTVRHDSCTDSAEREPDATERAIIGAAKAVPGVVACYAVSAEDRCGPVHFKAVLVQVRDEDGHVHTRYLTLP